MNGFVVKSFLSVLMAVWLVACVAAEATAVSDSLVAEYQRARLAMPSFRVESPEEYACIKEYREELVNDGITVNTFTLKDGQDCHCIDIFSQGVVRDLGISAESLLREPDLPWDEIRKARPTDSANRRITDDGVMLDGSLDPNGNPRLCPEHSFPRVIPRLEELCGFPTLRAYLANNPFPDMKGRPETRQREKSPAAPAAPATARRSVGRYHALGEQYVDCYGIGCDFNLWSPTTEDAEFSLAQLWATRGNGSGLQTIESGWQVYRPMYSDSRSHLFIYYTTNGHASEGDYIGCYNLRCRGFVQTDSSIAIGGGFTGYSSIGGPQYYMSIEFVREASTGNWWMVFNSQVTVGYYPASLFNAAGMHDMASTVMYGGEVYDDGQNGDTTTDMGSGKLPNEGFGQAAWIARAHYYGAGSTYADANPTTVVDSDTTKYNVTISHSADPNWRTYLYYGGPGFQGQDLVLQLYYQDHPATDCFSSGDPFDAWYQVQNPNTASRDADLYIAMSFMGSYYFWPSWGQVMDKKRITIPAQGQTSESFLGFLWPGEVGTINGLTFYGVATEPATYTVIGNVATLPFCALGSGDISFQLRWTFSGGGEGPDLDLHVIDPNGYHIYYGDPDSPDGGSLDADDQGACGPGDGGGPENIFWSSYNAPPGSYSYYVNWYADCGSYSSANFIIEVREAGNIVDTKQGTISSGGTSNYQYEYY